MTFQLPINYTDPLDFTFDPTKVTIDENGLRLALADVPQSWEENFDSDVGFTYDPLLLDFPGSNIEQLSQLPANAILGGIFPTGVFDLNWNLSGAVTAVLNGTPTNTAGGIVCTGTQGVGYTYTSQAKCFCQCVSNMGTQR